MKIYFASPLGFAESSKLYMEEMESLLRSCSDGVINPWTNPLGEEIEKAKENNS